MHAVEKMAKNLSYHFERPAIPKGKEPHSFIGFCPSENEIYLYVEATEFDEADYDWLLWIPILEHEHLHAILHRFRMPGFQQEPLLLALESLRLETVEDNVPNILECPICHKKSLIKDEFGGWCWECS